MSWFQNLTGALGAGSSNTGTPAASTNNLGASGASSVSAATYDNSGNPVAAGGGTRSNNSDNYGDQEGTGSNQNAQGQGSQKANKTPSVEELLFAPQEPAPNQNPNQAPNQTPDKGAPKSNEVELAPGLTSARLIQNLQSVNFMGTIPKETITNAMNGDADAFGQVLTSVAQMSAAIAVQQSVSANKASMDARFTEFDSGLTSRIGESRYSDILSDPKFSSPFVKPLAENLITRLRERDSSISPDQIKQVLPNLIQHAMKQFNGQDLPGSGTPSSTPNARTQLREVKFDELF